MSETPRVVIVEVGASAGGRLPPYQGEYTVAPDFNQDITLPTAQKSLTENITVERVPVYEVENPAGGITFILGS